jgi:predicted TIM-barrel fold metal-dependent hydrolase
LLRFQIDNIFMIPVSHLHLNLTTTTMASNSFVATEESYLSPIIPLGTCTVPSDVALHLIPPPILSKLKTLGPSRIRDMRASNTQLQIVSHIPIENASPRTCMKVNDAMYNQIVTAPDRFQALAMLPECGKEAARELGRCVEKYRFVGGVLGFKIGGIGEVTGNMEGKMHLGGREWEDLWATAERYKVPIALRVVFPTRNQVSVAIHALHILQYFPCIFDLFGS